MYVCNLICDILETWFSVDAKEPVGYALVEIVEGSNMKPSDMNGKFTSKCPFNCQTVQCACRLTEPLYRVG